MLLFCYLLFCFQNIDREEANNSILFQEPLGVPNHSALYRTAPAVAFNTRDNDGWSMRSSDTDSSGPGDRGFKSTMFSERL